MRTDIAVAGGGASGMMAAVCAAREAPDARVAVLERMNRVGKKLTATGNGRCNLTNINACDADYHGDAHRAQRVLSAYPPESVMRFFASIGVQPRVEEGGRVYPASEQASSVLDALRLSLREAGGEEIVGFELSGIEREADGFSLRAADGRAVYARRVIMATGGLTAPSLGGSESGLRILRALGHATSELYPALVQVRIEAESIRALKGIRFDGRAAIEAGGAERRSEAGEILFTDYGLSGIPIMQLSRVVSEACARGQEVFIRLSVLEGGAEDAARLLTKRRADIGARMLDNFLTGLVSKRLGQTLVKLALGAGQGLFGRPASSLTDRELAALAGHLTDWRLRVLGTLGFDQAQVTAGGVRGGEFDPGTLESTRSPGLYLTGELIDIDGDCGGFNLQWAWASGMAAGFACARSL